MFLLTVGSGIVLLGHRGPHENVSLSEAQPNHQDLFGRHCRSQRDDELQGGVKLPLKNQNGG